MTLEGKIVIRLRRGQPVQIESSRPLDICRRLQGLSPVALLERVPLLYALCGKAQQQAARLALAAADPVTRQLTAAEHDTANHRVVIEAALEYLWRFAIDLPQWAGQPPAVAPFAALRKALLSSVRSPCQAADLLATYLHQQLLGETLTQWSARSGGALQDWLQGDSPAAKLLRSARALERSAAGQAVSPMPLLPALPSVSQLQHWADAMAQAAFCAQPEWQGGCYETGALAYQQQHPWIAALQIQGEARGWLRLLARLLELEALTAQLCSLGNPDAALTGGLSLHRATTDRQAGIGLGWVKTARGLLLHRATLKAGLLDDYRILAPTEWNFHPRGALAAELAGWERLPQELLQRWVALQVISLDPCVGYQLEVYDA